MLAIDQTTSLLRLLHRRRLHLPQDRRCMSILAVTIPLQVVPIHLAHASFLSAAVDLSILATTLAE
jgi:hypothetical protein